MRFFTDKQTLSDLGFSSTGGKPSLKQFFTRTKTHGGTDFLDEIMDNPMSDATAIAERIAIVRYFLTNQIAFPFEGMMLDAAASYLDNADERTRLSGQKASHDSALNKVLGVDTQTKLVMEGAKAVLDTFATMRAFLAKMNQQDTYFTKIMGDMDILFEELDGLKLPELKQKVTFDELSAYDALYRFKKRAQVLKVFGHIYQLDAWVSVATVAREKGFALPTVIDRDTLTNKDAVYLAIDGLYHPQVPNAKANSLTMDGNDNLVFLTGANMAGKSTFMKSVGIGVYLAHIGFPVPAKSLIFAVFDGLISSINLSDNLDMGYSHFLAEVKRIRKVAQMVAQGQRIFVLFDELFRGTNVKDAYEGTVELSKAFAARKSSAFVISTHIIEAADDLKAATSGIQYLYLPTVMEGSKPVYTYKLQEGVTADRHGMLIINNEGILEMLDGAQTNTPAQQEAAFLTDAQTQKDLNLLGRFDPHSIFSLFNRTRTKGGEILLEKWFHEPFVNPEKINNRSHLFKYFARHGLVLELDEADFSLFERYIASRKATSKIAVALGILSHKVAQQIVKDEKYEETIVGILASLRVLKVLKSYFEKPELHVEAGAFGERLNWANDLLNLIHKQGLLATLRQDDFTWKDTVNCDYNLSQYADRILELVDLIYEIDVYQSVASIANERGFCYAEALSQSAAVLAIEEGRHPKLEKGVGNSIHMKQGNNLIFLTGANMAGKSTFMKTASINLYLAHMGFPVAAQSMHFSVRQGIFTSINVNDNLQQGFSHYYAEVMRVKTIAEQVSQGKHLFVLFDELFKGTNVKDAFDATLAVTKSFVTFKNTFFIISTHIVEVGEEIAKENNTVSFRYMPTVMVDQVPTYTYQALEGISADKHGMIIIRNEGILDLLNN